MYCSDQHAVWNDIDEKSRLFNTYSETDAMQDIYASIEEKIREYEKSLKLQSQSFGCVTFISGKIAGCDLFGDCSIFNKAYRKLLQGYILEAIQSGTTNGKGRAKDLSSKVSDFFTHLKAASKEVYKSTGEGYDIRFETASINGFALLNQNETVHLAAFAE